VCKKPAPQVFCTLCANVWYCGVEHQLDDCKHSDSCEPNGHLAERTARACACDATYTHDAARDPPPQPAAWTLPSGKISVAHLHEDADLATIVNAGFRRTLHDLGFPQPLVTMVAHSDPLGPEQACLQNVAAVMAKVPGTVPAACLIVYAVSYGSEPAHVVGFRLVAHVVCRHLDGTHTDPTDNPMDPHLVVLMCPQFDALVADAIANGVTGKHVALQGALVASSDASDDAWTVLQFYRDKSIERVGEVRAVPLAASYAEFVFMRLRCTRCRALAPRPARERRLWVVEGCARCTEQA
jgi:hypothetical protein